MNYNYDFLTDETPNIHYTVIGFSPEQSIIEQIQNKVKAVAFYVADATRHYQLVMVKCTTIFQTTLFNYKITIKLISRISTSEVSKQQDVCIYEGLGKDWLQAASQALIKAFGGVVEDHDLLRF